MDSKKSLKELIGKVDVLQESQKGQLKGGYTSLSSLSSLLDNVKNKDRCNNNCTTNNCYASTCS